MDLQDPFSLEILNGIFKCDSSQPDRVLSRENSALEFKQSFGWKSITKYMKTSAAFANAKGGYIVFGVSDKPRRLGGLDETNKILFKDIDPERLTSLLNEHFSPEIAWDVYEHTLDGKLFGIIYIHEATSKPVICTKNKDDLIKEGDIYYRYRGRTERIRYPELRDILESKREAEQRLWMKHLANIARIGVREVGIFDLNTGTVTGTGGSFLIDESLLGHLSFIREGEFSEVKGKPTLKLIGQVEPMPGIVLGATKKEVVKQKGIQLPDIIFAALREQNIDCPHDYAVQVCHENSATLPVYYFIKKSGLTVEETADRLDRVISRSPAKRKLIERLREKKRHYSPLPTGPSSSSLRKRELAESLRNGEVPPEMSEDLLDPCLSAMLGLTADEIQKTSPFLRELLLTWFSKYYTSANPIRANLLRKAICWVDEALHMDNL